MVDMFRMYCQIINLASALTIHVILLNVLPLTAGFFTTMTEVQHLEFCELVMWCSKIQLFLCVCTIHPSICLTALLFAQVLMIESSFVSA